ncbi:HEXXH motif-containing protein [Amycolatopsis pretoriensis]|uniref:HEXXH motif-containing protein n=2 Tax=Amycolatopsis pretoriensis TaxID=218821 RepID=A0A1H5QNF3_9PSEU|nr:HEXXH motif-containing protein [Amycolatopsis pretoriensis]
MRALLDETTESEEMFRPLPSPGVAWDLLARAQHAAAGAVEKVLAHPYVGSWVGYTTRLYRHDVSSDFPLWVHVGYVRCLAAAAAILAGIVFEIEVPAWGRYVALPTLGMAELSTDDSCAVVVVRGHHGCAEVVDRHLRVHVHHTDPRWHPIREVDLIAAGRRLALRLDDVDPYRGLYKPQPSSRLTTAEVESWRTVLEGAWRLLVTHLPAVAEALPAGLESVVPEPAVPFRLPTASTGEAFGSAIVSYSRDPTAMAAALVHEFQHIRLGSLLHLVRLHQDDRRERFYAPWRDDPRPLGGVIHGVYAFFGVATFWRALSRAEPENLLAAFEFALWRRRTWRTLLAVHRDDALTPAGRRFLAGIAERLGPWQTEPVAPEALLWANRAITDHYAGWRIRHLRPDPDLVTELVGAWRNGSPRVIALPPDSVPNAVPDGRWPDARADLIRLRLSEGGTEALHTQGPLVPGATSADLAFVAGETAGAAVRYRAELAADPDSPSALAGLGLALTARTGGPSSRALVHRPELVRAVHRSLRPSTAVSVETVAEWIGRFVLDRR